MIDQHDNDVIGNFVEIVGYTIKDVWKVNSSLCTDAINQHHKMSRHHPEHFRKYPNVKNNMDFAGLLESVVDLIAGHWERHFKDRTVLNTVIYDDLPDRYLDHYTAYDKSRVRNILKSCVANSQKQY